MGEELVRGALIFDFDGLIIDTEGPEFQTWTEIFRERSVELDLATWAVGIGTLSTLDPYLELELRLGHAVNREEDPPAAEDRRTCCLRSYGTRDG